MSLLALIVGLAGGAEIDFSALPQKVQVSINRQLDGGMVHEIRREQTNGHSIFIVGIRNEGERRHLRFDAEGRIRQ